MIFSIAISHVGSVAAQDGNLLQQFQIPARVPHPVYFPVGVAFDGTNLYYSDPADKEPDIFLTTTGGVLLRIIPLVLEAGGLAWDGHTLWVGSFAAFGKSSVARVFQVSVSQTPTVLKTLDLSRIFGPDNECGFISGLDFDASTNSLWVAPNAGCQSGTSRICQIGHIYNIDTNGNLLRRVVVPFGTKGVSRVGSNLYISACVLNQPETIFKTTLDGTVISSFEVGTMEDSSFDPVTFAPNCALWVQHRVPDPQFLDAFQIGCP